MSSGNDNDLLKRAEDAQRLAAAANAMMSDYKLHTLHSTGRGRAFTKHIIIQMSEIFLNCRYYKVRLKIIFHI